MSDNAHPVTTNPGAVGDSEQAPIVQLPPDVAALFEHARCPECERINQTHHGTCTNGKPQ